MTDRAGSVFSNQKHYPRTFTSDNVKRRDFLPCFPPSNDRQRPPFLLTSVPVPSIALEQYRQRQRPSSVDTNAFHFVEINRGVPSFMMYMYRNLYGAFSERCKIDPNLIDYNLTRLDECLAILAIDGREQYWTVEQQEQGYQTSFAMNEWSTALEFFLQMDVDMFFLKTCSFRGACPRTVIDPVTKAKDIEGIFCVEPPVARYGMTRCGRSLLVCRCCRHDSRLATTPMGSIFSSSYSHRFVNSYQAILNCPVTCTTSNIIYALTCPCGEFDYVGETTIPFCDRLFCEHRREFMISTIPISFKGITVTSRGSFTSFLIGPINADTPKSTEMRVKDRMRLYRHSSLCSTAMQVFLDHNPHYWCLVPMKSSEADREDQAMLPDNDVPNRDEGQSFIDQLPSPMAGYRFSQRQKNEQRLFFRNKLHCTAPSMDFDLYHAAIVIVLPDDCSELLRRFVEALLITHAETKLNTAGHLTHYDRHYQRIISRNPLAHGLWVDGLIHPTCPSFSTD